MKTFKDIKTWNVPDEHTALVFTSAKKDKQVPISCNCPCCVGYLIAQFPLGCVRREIIGYSIVMYMISEQPLSQAPL